jgi:hypothetical protein
VSDGAIQNTPQKIGRLLKGLVVFVLLGPLIGSLTFLVPAFIHAWMGSTSPDPSLWNYFTFITPVLIFGIFAGYFIGVIPAAAAGLLCLARDAKLHGFNVLHAGAVGLAIGILFVLFTLLVGGLPPRWSAHNVADVVFRVMSCVVASVVCWPIARYWRKRT